MAKRSRESFQKRAREKARQEKQEEKRLKRQSSSPDDDSVGKAEETALMEEFASLNERFESGRISPEDFNDERDRIFEQLGLEVD